MTTADHIVGETGRELVSVKTVLTLVLLWPPTSACTQYLESWPRHLLELAGLVSRKTCSRLSGRVFVSSTPKATAKAWSSVSF